MKFLTRILLITLCISVLACAKSGLSDDDIQYIRLSAALMRLKSTLPQDADSATIQPKLDSTFRAFKMTRDGYIEYSTSLGKDPAKASLIYNAIKDSLGLH